jgi:oligopeptide/dipeptide ABC transporter ATP-binding protein
MSAPLLAVDGLQVEFPARTRGGAPIPVVRDLTFSIARGEMVGLVGESGSGKSVTALAILGLLPRSGRVAAGSIRLDGKELLGLSDRALQPIRGGRIGLIFQEPMTALNPVLSVGFQVSEAVRAHRDLKRAAARAEAARLLDLVAIPDPHRRLDDYPHQLSGGQRQRVMIAMALAGQPDLLLADEPTTALDVTVQAQILDLLLRLKEELGLAVLLITHDLAVVAETCRRVLVMYAGEMVETAPVERLFRSPAHPYTRGLLRALPHLGQPAPRGELPSIPGQVPNPAELPPGCPFAPRCGEVLAVCREERAPLVAVAAEQVARCFLHAPQESP